jgi:acetyl-CoA synthetase
MTNHNPALQRFLEARDFLLAHRSDYDAAYGGFKWPVLDEFNWALDYFDTLGRGEDRPALWLVGEDGAEQKFSFAEMAARSNQVANFLRKLGVMRGDHILLMLGNDAPLWDAMLAAIKLGAVVVPTTTLVTPADLRDRLERGNVRHAIVAAAHCDKFAQVTGDYTRIAIGAAPDGWRRFEDAYGETSEFQPDGITHATDPMLLYFTSGTTAQPKLVLHSQQSYPAGHLSTMYWLGLQPGDVHLNVSSPGWAKHAWSCFFAPWDAGATVFIYNFTRFSAPALLAAIEKHGVTSLCAPPTVWRMLIQENLSRYKVALREVSSAGEPLNPEVIERVRKAWGITIRDGYGQTETTAVVCNSPGQKLKAGSMGRPAIGYRIELLDLDGKPAAEGEVGIALDPHPLGLMLGYADDPEKNAHVARDGYYRTGDVAARDEDGYITYVGRADDVVKSSDYRISPFELESALIEHPAIAEAAVVPSPDPLRLSVPKAFVTLAAGHQASDEVARDIFGFVRERLASYKRVRRLEFGDLPKTISGKIRRVDLRAIESARIAGERRPNEYFVDDFAGPK